MSERNSSLLEPMLPEEPSLKLQLLSTVDIFRDLDREEIDELQGMLDMFPCKKGQILYRPEEKAELLFMLKKGKVEVYSLTADGKRLTVETIGAGTFFGEMPLTAQSMHHNFAEAVEHSLVCVLSKRDLEQLLLRKPQVALRLVENLSRRLEETRAKLEDATLRKATARICRALGRLDQGTSAPLGLTHQELADSTGLFRETVTNVLNRLQAQGLIELGKKKITIIDRGGLEEAAQI